MEIQKISRDSINFKKIQLNKAEQKKAFDLLTNLTKTDVSSKVDKIKFDIFELFDPHLQKEAFSTSAKFVFGKDFLQTLYLKFIELLEKVNAFIAEIKKNGKFDAICDAYFGDGEKKIFVNNAITITDEVIKDYVIDDIKGQIIGDVVKK